MNKRFIQLYLTLNMLIKVLRSLPDLKQCICSNGGKKPPKSLKLLVLKNNMNKEKQMCLQPFF